MADTRLPVGTPVQVRNQFDRAWSSGFEVADVRVPGEGYRVLRRSDRAVLPLPFGEGELRAEGVGSSGVEDQGRLADARDHR